MNSSDSRCAEENTKLLDVLACVLRYILYLATDLFYDEIMMGRYGNKLVEIGYLNALFALARCIGIIGHIFDQKRLKAGLYRHPWDDIVYMVGKTERGSEQSR